MGGLPIMESSISGGNGPMYTITMAATHLISVYTMHLKECKNFYTVQ